MLGARGKKKIIQLVAVAGLGVAAREVGAGSAKAASYGTATNNCYGIYWHTAWGQECGIGGASAAGYFKSTANCTAPQPNDITFEKYRIKGETARKNGTDCDHGIHGVTT